jgi:hypothetical protein
VFTNNSIEANIITKTQNNGLSISSLTHILKTGIDRLYVTEYERLPRSIINYIHASDQIDCSVREVNKTAQIPLTGNLTSS